MNFFMQRTVLSLALVSSIISVAFAQEIEIPFHLKISRPVIEVYVNNSGPFQFIVDTGASGNVMDTTVTKSLGLTEKGTLKVGSPGSSKTIDAKVYTAALSIPGTPFKVDTEVVGLDFRSRLPVDGVLSINFFKEYLTSFDFPNSKITLTKGTLDSKTNGVLKLYPNAMILSFDSKVDSITVETHLDSGNPGSFDLPYGIKDKLKLVGELTENGRIQTRTGTHKKWSGKIEGVIEVGNIKFLNPEVNFIEGFNHMNIGSSILQQIIPVIDISHGRILFKDNRNAVNKSQKTKVENTARQQTSVIGSYGNGSRIVFLENGKLFLRREGAPPLELVYEGQEVYQMTFTRPVANKLPKVRFEKNADGTVNGLTYLHDDGAKDFLKKD